MTKTLSILYTTIDSLETAESLAELAVNEQLAACVNIIPSMTSIYQWQGKLEKNQEVILLFKTSQEKMEALKTWLIKHHPYEVPAVLVADVHTTDEFHAWVKGISSK